jgi:hypothetical protein
LESIPAKEIRKVNHFPRHCRRYSRSEPFPPAPPKLFPKWTPCLGTAKDFGSFVNFAPCILPLEVTDLFIILMLMCAPLESLYYFLRYFLFGVHKVQDEAHIQLPFTIDRAHAKDLQTLTPDSGRSGSSRLYPCRETQEEKKDSRLSIRCAPRICVTKPFFCSNSEMNSHEVAPGRGVWRR